MKEAFWNLYRCVVSFILNKGWPCSTNTLHRRDTMWLLRSLGHVNPYSVSWSLETPAQREASHHVRSPFILRLSCCEEVQTNCEMTHGREGERERPRRERGMPSQSPVNLAILAWVQDIWVKKLSWMSRRFQPFEWPQERHAQLIPVNPQDHER